MARAFSSGRRKKRRAKRGGFLSLPISPMTVAMSAFRLQLRDDVRNGPVDVPGPEDEDDVAGDEDGLEKGPDSLQVRLEVDLLMAELADLLVQCLPGHSGNGVFAGGVDLRQHEHVGLVEGRGEDRHELRQAGVAMRLENSDDAAIPAPFGRLERGLDLGRVVGIILDDHDVVDDLAQLEAAPGPGVALESLEDGVRRDVEVEAHGGRGHGVEDVVNPRHLELQRPQILPPGVKDRRAAELVEGEIAGGQVGLGREAIGDDPPLDLRDDALEIGIVEAEDDRAIERDLVGEVDEGRLEVVDALVLVEVLLVDVRQDGDEGGEVEERAVALVGLGDDEVPGSELGVGPDRVQAAADDDRRVEAAGLEDERGHGRRRRLAMGAGHGNAVLHPHELGQHLGPGDDRDQALPGLDDFDVVLADGRRDDDDVGVLEVLGPVADGDLRAEAHEPACGVVLLEIGAGNLVAEVEQDLGDAVHAGPADADHVDVVELAVAFLGQAGISLGERFIRERQSAAIRPAGSSTCSRATFRSMASSSAGWSRKPRIRAASAPAVDSASGMTTAPPTDSSSRAFRVWWSSAAPAKGTRIEALRAAMSSASVVAPARQRTRSARPK